MQVDFPDGDRPTKKMRVDDPPRSPGASSDVVDDEDDIYGEPTASLPLPSNPQKPPAGEPVAFPSQLVQAPSVLPGLGRLHTQEHIPVAVSGHSPVAVGGTAGPSSPPDVAGTEASEKHDGIATGGSQDMQVPSSNNARAELHQASEESSQPTPIATSTADSLRESGNAQSSPGISQDNGQEIEAHEGSSVPPLHNDSMKYGSTQQLNGVDGGNMQVAGEPKAADSRDQPMTTIHEQEVVADGADMTNGDIHKPAIVSTRDDPPPDPTLAADLALLNKATGVKDNHKAEFQFDSSDAASSDSSDSSDSDSSDSAGVESDDDDYPLLGPEEQARMLMAEGGGSDDEGPQRRLGVKSGPKTANEVKDANLEKPDVTVTPEMEILELGTAQSIVENYLLIRGTTSGETQVLESGSVLCLPDRTVIGAVAEPLGRVDTPMYSVAFTSAEDIAGSGVTIGCKIFYVRQHSSYVFTQPLKNMKYTDASNLHDEDVDDDEMEFSDDEAEAAYKRSKKQEKLAKKGITPGNGSKKFGPPTHPGSASSTYPETPIQYDDEEAESMYTPLSRPGHNELPPKPVASVGQASQRGNHRGRGERGRGDRGRAQRGRERGRGGRGSHQTARAALPPQEAIAPPQAYAGKAEYRMSPYSAPQYPQPSNYWSPPPPPPPPPAPVSPNPAFNPPPGSFVNPAFFQRQQQGVPFPPAQHYGSQHYGAQQQQHYGVPPNFGQQQSFQYPRGQHPGGGFGSNQSRQWDG